MSSMGGTPPPGWYPAPDDPSRVRYWDGTGWTQHSSAPGSAAAPRTVGFSDAVMRGLRGWTDYRTRATVAEYWWYALFTLIVVIGAVAVLSVIVALAGGSSGSDAAYGTGAAGTAVGVVVAILAVGFYVVMIATSLALAVRRLHDVDKSGWWYLIGLIPFGGLVLLIFFLQAGTPGSNRYGPVPQ